MAFRDWPIRQKLTAILLVISGLVLLLTSAAFATYEVLAIRRRTVTNLSTLGRVLAANSTAALAFANAADAREILSALRAEPHIVAAGLYTQDGRLFTRYPADLPDDAIPARPEMDGYRFERGYIIGLEPVAEAGNPRLGTLYLKSDLKAVSRTLRLSVAIGAGVLAISLLAAYVMAALLQGRISQPITALADAAAAVSARQDYSVRAPKVGADELGALTDAFNQMLGHIQEQERALRAHALELEQRVAERTHELEERNQALRESEERYRLLFDSNPLPAWVFDVETLRFLAVNDAAVRHYGYGREEFEAMTIKDIRPPEDVPRVLAAVAQPTPGVRETGTWRHRKRDGTLIDVEITSHALSFGGRPAELVIAVDITERQRAERALRTSEERFQALAAGLKDYAIFWLDPEGRVASWNAGAERLKGYRAEEIVGQHFSRFYTPEDIAAGKPERELRIATTEGRVEDEGWRVRRDGSRLWANVIMTALWDARGTLLGFGKITRDMSERKRAEQALRTSEERFRTLAVTANDAIISADDNGDITYFNPGAERMFGYAGTEVVGKPITVLMPERFHAAHRAGMQRYLATREARVVGKTVELTGRRKDGGEFPVDLSLAAWESGEATAFTAIMRDITDRKRRDEQLRRYAAQLEAANAELDAFAYSVSHDLRAPLRSIDGFSQALLEDYGERLDDAARGHLDRVRAASQRMAQLIDDLLELSRVTRAELRRERVDLSALAQSVVAELQRNDAERAVEIAIAPGMAAEADPHLVRVVLENLLANAWKYTAKRAGARIEFGYAPHDGQSAYFVRDNGAGFDMAYANKLFGAFQRLHSSREFEGTGIGLATVQRIVHRHGGKVWAEAAVGQGATFYFTL